MTPAPVLVVAAAGQGSRLNAGRPKFLVEVAGRPMIDWVLDIHRRYVSRVVLIVAPAAVEDARRLVVEKSNLPVDFAIQERPTGMLDAVLLAGPAVAASGAARVWVTWCDQIAIDPRTIRRLAESRHNQTALTMPVVRRRDPYIHFDRDDNGRILVVRQRREGDVMPEVGEGDAGLFSFSRAAFLDALPAYAGGAVPGSRTHERNLLPFIPWLAAHAEVATFPCVDEMESVGINTPDDLATVQRHLAARTPPVTLSIVIPAFNEDRFIGTLLERIGAVDLTRFGLTTETIVVDDGSTDRTAAIAGAFTDVVLLRQANAGKGAAVRAGLARATGDYVLVQDADLEYDPNDYIPMLDALLSGRGDIVYGSRYTRRGKPEGQTWTAYLGGRSLSLVARLFTGTYLTDTVTAYKLFPRADLLAVRLNTSGFELDHEITAKMLARHKRIVEVPISYRPRSRAEGKKIGLRDWFIAVRTLWRYGRLGPRASQ